MLNKFNRTQQEQFELSYTQSYTHTLLSDKCDSKRDREKDKQLTMKF